MDRSNPRLPAIPLTYLYKSVAVGMQIELPCMFWLCVRRPRVDEVYTSRNDCPDPRKTCEKPRERRRNGGECAGYFRVGAGRREQTYAQQT